jgi:hypothetical protein
MSVSKELAVEVAAEIKKAVEAILASHGMAKPKVKTTFGDIFKFTIESSVEQKDPSGVNINSAEAVYYTRFGHVVYDDDFKATELVAPLGTKFTSGGVEYAFAGINSRKPKFSISVVRVSDGATLGMTDTVVPLLNRTAALALAKACD